MPTSISGIVKKLDVPIEGITVFVYERDTGTLVGTTISAMDGTFNVSGLVEDRKYTVTAISNDPNYNNAIDDGLYNH